MTDPVEQLLNLAHRHNISCDEQSAMLYIETLIRLKKDPADVAAQKIQQHFRCKFWATKSANLMDLIAWEFCEENCETCIEEEKRWQQLADAQLAEHK